MNYKTVKLSEVADISIGKTPSRNNPKYWDKNKESKNIWLSIRDMSKINDKYIDDSREYISNEGAKLFNEVPKGTLIMSFKLSIGKLAITKNNLRTNEAIAAFKIKDNLIISRDYLYFFLKSIDWDRFAGDDIKVKGKTLNKAKLKEVLISFPKLEEQQHIVSKLDNAFAEINKNIEIANKKEIKIDKLKSKLLSSFLNSNDEKFQKVKLSDVCTINNGGTPKSDKKSYWGGKIEWLTPKDMGKMTDRFISKTGRQITSEGLANSSAKLIPENSIILSCRAPIGHIAINKVSMSFNQGCKGLVPNDKILFQFLYYFLFSSKKLLNDLGTGTTFKEISSKPLSNINISLPTILEQRDIIKKIDEVFKQLKIVNKLIIKSKINYKSLKQAILKKELGTEMS